MGGFFMENYKTLGYSHRFSPNHLGYLTPKETESFTGIKTQTLANHRSLGIGIPYCRVNGRQIRYKLSDVIDFMEANRVQTDPIAVEGGEVK